MYATAKFYNKRVFEASHNEKVSIDNLSFAHLQGRLYLSQSSRRARQKKGVKSWKHMTKVQILIKWKTLQTICNSSFQNIASWKKKKSGFQNSQLWLCPLEDCNEEAVVEGSLVRGWPELQIFRAGDTAQGFSTEHSSIGTGFDFQHTCGN